MEDEFYDPEWETSDRVNTKSVWYELKLILFRLPSVILADLILFNSDFILNEFNNQLGTILNYIFILILSKLVIFLSLLLCLFLFTLKLKYTINIYKLVILILIPFYFNTVIKHIHNNNNSKIDFEIISIKIPSVLVILAIYSLAVSITIILYNSLYENCILDKYKIHERYQAVSRENDEAVNQFLDSLLVQRVRNYFEHTTAAQATNVNQAYCLTNEQIKSALNRRRIFMLFYTFLSFLLNEIDFFSNKMIHFTEDNTKQIYVVRICFFALFFYDLTCNLDQLLLRFVIKLRFIGRLINDYGLNNLISYNWFERLKVALMFRIYFMIKCIYFTICFFIFYDYYLNLNKQMKFESKNENFSLYETIIWLFRSVLSSDKVSNSSQSSLTDVTNGISSTNNNQNLINTFNSKASTSSSSGTTDDTDLAIIRFFINYLTDYFSFLNFFLSDQSETIQDLINDIILFFKMLILNQSETLISIGSVASVLSLQFYLLGQFVLKLTTISSSTNDQHTNNNNNNNNNNRHQLGAVNNPELNNENLHIRRQNVRHEQQIQANENDLFNAGDVAAILFFLLSIQSGLSSLSGQVRIEKFLKNYTLLFIAILHYFHTGLDNQLMSLCASSRPNWYSEKHLRVLSVCSLLILIPAFFLYILWNFFPISTWLLAASAFNIELIVKMSVTIVLYSLFVIDSKRITSSYERISVRETPSSSSSTEQVSNDDSSANSRMDELSDNLDDYIYYIKAFGHVMEFIVAIFLFFNGAYILLFESYGAIRAIMMCIHAYFHIWFQAQKGWSIFMKRRTAISKLKRLAIFDRQSFYLMNRKKFGDEDPNQNYLDSNLDEEFNRRMHDLCAICFCELSSHESRITNCNHLFHSICLRKWLYLQDTCPMCHQLVYASSTKK